MGTTILELLTPRGLPPMKIQCDVLNVDISLLLCLDILAKHFLLAGTAVNRLVKRTVISGCGNEPLYAIDDWFLPI